MARRALQAGSRLASRLNDTGAYDFYLEQSMQVSYRLMDFWREDLDYWRATLLDHDNTEEEEGIGVFKQRKKTGLDCAVPLAVVHAGDLGMGTWSAADDRMLSTLRLYVLSFDGLYGINKGKEWTEGWAVGRYAEDVYNGIGISKGNPWCVRELRSPYYPANKERLIKKVYLHVLCSGNAIPSENRICPEWSDRSHTLISTFLVGYTRTSRRSGRASHGHGLYFV